MCGDALAPLNGAAFVLKRGTDKAVRSAFAAVREDDVRCQKWLCGEKKAVRGAPSKSNTIMYFFVCVYCAVRFLKRGDHVRHNETQLCTRCVRAGGGGRTRTEERADRKRKRCDDQSDGEADCTLSEVEEALDGFVKKGDDLAQFLEDTPRKPLRVKGRTMAEWVGKYCRSDPHANAIFDMLGADAAEVCGPRPVVDDGGEECEEADEVIHSKRAKSVSGRSACLTV